MNYYEEIKPKQAEVILCGKKLQVLRAGLLLHLELASLPKTVDSWVEYIVKASGLTPEIVGGASLDEVGLAYRQLTALNSLHGIFPFMGKGKHTDILDYEGREAAGLVHQLARAYGWTRHYIGELQPEEALFYLLEIAVSDHNEREFYYQVGYAGYNKQGRKNPFPPLRMAWPGKKTKLKKIEMPLSKAQEMGLAPAGVTINLEDLYRKRK